MLNHPNRKYLEHLDTPRIVISQNVEEFQYKKIQEQETGKKDGNQKTFVQDFIENLAKSVPM
jgi:hypothetical protein